MQNKKPSHSSDRKITVEQFYQKEFNQIHVPQKLKEETLQKMLQRNETLRSNAPTAQITEITEKTQGNTLPFSRYVAQLRILAVAAAFLFVVGASSFFFSNRIPPVQVVGLPSDYSTMYRASGDVSVTPTAGETAAESVFPEQIHSFRLKETACYYVKTQTKDVIDNIVELRYTKADRVLTVISSHKEVLAPAALFAVEAREIGGVSVFFGKDQNTGNLYAAWGDSGALFAARLENGTNHAFITAIKSFIKAT